LGICVHMMDAKGEVKDFVLGLPELYRQHNGVNIAGVVAATLTNLGVNQDSVGYFVLDNAYNNDTAVASLANLYGFQTVERRLRCCCHILNLGAQVIIWGKDRDAYENDGGNLEVSLVIPSEYYINLTCQLLSLLQLSSSTLLKLSFKKDDYDGEQLRRHAMSRGQR
jgi:hypothetical protein